MTTHGCGHCGATFETMSDLRDHTEDCDDRQCLVCGADFDDPCDVMAHAPCPDADPVPDPEAEFRAERRRRAQARRDDRRIREERRVGR